MLLVDMVATLEKEANALAKMAPGEDFELAPSSLNRLKVQVMRQITGAMVRQEHKLKGPRKSHKKLREEYDLAFVAWQKTRMLKLRKRSEINQLSA